MVFLEPRKIAKRQENKHECCYLQYFLVENAKFKQSFQNDTFTVRLCTFSKVTLNNPSETRAKNKNKSRKHECFVRRTCGDGGDDDDDDDYV